MQVKDVWKINKLEKLIGAGFKVEIQPSSKFCLTLNSTPCMRFNSDSVEEVIDSAYDFVKEQKKVEDEKEEEEKEDKDKKEKEDKEDKDEKDEKDEKESEITKIIIAVPKSRELKIDDEILNGEFKTTTTVRLYSEVCEKFKEFIESYNEYKSTDLISMALLEYMEKYKKDKKDDE